MDIHPISNGYSTAYLAVSDGTAMLVDASTPDIAPKVLATLAEVGARLRLIVLTHFHYDHVGAADPLRRATGARVAIHHLDADALRRGGELHLTPARLMGRALAPVLTRGLKAPVEPDLELGDKEDLSEHGGIGHSFWTPGHTPGSLSVLLPDGTVLAGDALSEGFPPLHRAEGPMFVDDADAARQSVLAITDAAQGNVRIAHFGRLEPRSLAKLAERSRSGGPARP